VVTTMASFDPAIMANDDDVIERMEASTEPATRGYINKLLMRFARDSGAALKEAIAKRFDPLQERAAKTDATVASLQHQLSRQATHLQNLQDRIKDLETR